MFDGRLFGSVTNADIAEAIVAAGIQAAKANVRLPNGPLKAVGEYELKWLCTLTLLLKLPLLLLQPLSN